MRVCAAQMSSDGVSSANATQCESAGWATHHCFSLSMKRGRRDKRCPPRITASSSPALPRELCPAVYPARCAKGELLLRARPEGSPADALAVRLGCRRRGGCAGGVPRAVEMLTNAYELPRWTGGRSLRSFGFSASASGIDQVLHAFHPETVNRNSLGGCSRLCPFNPERAPLPRQAGKPRLPGRLAGTLGNGLRKKNSS